jgi:hypothetical protein
MAYGAEAIQLPAQSHELSAVRFYAGRNLATRTIDLRMAQDIGDDALIEQSEDALSAAIVEGIGQ